MIARSFPLISALVYWFLVVMLLLHASPVFWDGCGPMPSFRWTRLPAPGMRGYFQHQQDYEFIFFLPYAAAASVMTLVAFAAVPRLRRRTRTLSSRTFTETTLLTLVSLVALALISDLGSHAQIWTAGAITAITNRITS